MPSKAHIARLLGAIDAAGSVVLANGAFVLQPTGSPAVPLDEVLDALRHAASASPAHADACTKAQADLSVQQAAILAGEQAANARLQSALDSLQPKHDYYQYG